MFQYKVTVKGYSMVKQTVNASGASSSRKRVVGSATVAQILGPIGAPVKTPPHNEGWGTRMVTRENMHLMATASVIHRT